MMIKNLPIVMAETGIIKIGRKGKEITTKSGKKMRLPEKLDHFIVTTTERGPDDNFILDKDIMAALPPNPKEIDVILPFPNVESNFVTSLKFYSGKTAICVGDNKKAIRTKKDGKKEEVECNYETCPFFKAHQCKMTGTLSVILPQSRYIGGVYKYRTTSWHGVIKTLSSMLFIESLTGGRMAGIKLTMKLLSGTAEVNGKATGYHYVTLIYKGDDVNLIKDLRTIKELRRDELKQLDLIEADYVKSVEKEHTSTSQEEQEEFYPENTVEQGMVVEKSTGEIVDSVDSVEEIPLNVKPEEGRNFTNEIDIKKEDGIEEQQKETNVEPNNQEPQEPDISQQETPKQGNIFEQSEKINTDNKDVIAKAEPITDVPETTEKNIDQRSELMEEAKKWKLPIKIFESYEKKNNVKYPMSEKKFEELKKTVRELGALYSE